MLVKAKQAFLLIADIFILYLTLFLVLLIRYGKINQSLINDHIGPFSVVFVLWLIIFYITGLYDIGKLKPNYEYFQQLMVSVVVGSGVAVLLFYLIPSFKISPKTSLAVFSLLFLIIESVWRWTLSSWFSGIKRNVLIIGFGEEIKELENFIFQNPQIGYKVKFQIQNKEDANSEFIQQVIKENSINTIIIDNKSGWGEKIFDNLYKYMSGGVEIITLALAYETILKKLPISEVRDLSLVSEISRSRRVYESIKRPLELFLAIVMFCVFFIPMVIIYLLVRLTSKGPGIYKQKRVGKDEKEFVLYKFRTMRVDAEKDGPKWSWKNDDRVTKVGKILRYTHLDELPQLWNVILGDISFVGPRPERPEFVKSLKEKIPYYEIRHIIKPGITGWAQVNYKYGSSIEDAIEKLQFDFFYLKNRSLTLDILIILKTVKMFIFNYK
jgi:exopolysaccharide biosynthesis polyprenyl glycosylphosphotransferase